jgi:hypothetical protein
VKRSVVCGVFVRYSNIRVEWPTKCRIIEGSEMRGKVGLGQHR